MIYSSVSNVKQRVQIILLNRRVKIKRVNEKNDQWIEWFWLSEMFDNLFIIYQ